MTAIECGRALRRLTGAAETSPPTEDQPSELETGAAAAATEVDRVVGAPIA
jgi:hypothetical protein